ncbi:MAG: hypothetical protein OEM03_08535 [Chromatiales bacterium]|nr:hypothetical protein [Chromatiales bacterium]
MNNIKKSAQACFYSLLFVTVTALFGGCATEHYVGYQNVGSNGPDCEKKGRKAVYTVVVNYAVNAEGISCPDSVTFLQGDNGCKDAPVTGNKYPPVCLCGSRDEGLAWVADQKVPPNTEFAIHFSPFQNGSFESNGGEVKPQKIVPVKMGPKIGDRVFYEYSITAGDACRVIDPPVIIKR